MDLNALIAQGGTQNVQPPNQLDLYTKAMALQHAQNQNALAQYSLSSAQRADQEANALRQGIPADFDINNPAHRSALIKLSPVGGAALIEKLSKADQEMTMSGKHRADTTKTLQDVQSQAMRDMVSDPSDDNVKRVIGDLVRQRVLTPERGQAALDRTLSMTPQQRIDNWVTLGVPAKDLAAMLQPKPEKIDTGAAIEMRDMNPRSSTFGKQLPQFGEPIAKGQTPDARLAAEVSVATNAENNATARAGQRSAAQTAANALAFQSDPERQAAIAGARETAKVTANANVTTEMARKHEKEGAKQVLKTLNYDPATGTDDISKLIPKSTSGMVQRAGSVVMGELTGTGTSGAEAIAQLGAMANKLALDIAGGKLGAGISNTDRDFIAASLGDTANPNLNANVRYAAWKAARGRLEQLAGGGGSKPITTAPALPPGFKKD